MKLPQNRKIIIGIFSVLNYRSELAITDPLRKDFCRLNEQHGQRHRNRKHNLYLGNGIYPVWLGRREHAIVQILCVCVCGLLYCWKLNNPFKDTYLFCKPAFNPHVVCMVKYSKSDSESHQLKFIAHILASCFLLPCSSHGERLKGTWHMVYQCS